MICWITEQIGSAPYEEIAKNGDYRIIDVRQLVDDRGNSVEQIREKINLGIDLLSQGHKIIVCCDYGISRSNAVAAGILSIHQNLHFHQALNLVLSKTKAEIKLELLNIVRESISTQSSKMLFSEKNKILMTGGSGLLGGALLPVLQEQQTVIAPKRSELNLLVCPAALGQYVQENNITHIFHLAAPRIFNTYQAFGDALLMLRNTLEVCRTYGIHFIYLSGWVVFSGYKAAHLVAHEQLPLWPQGLYGETKYFCENLISYYIQQYNLKCSVVRAGPVYGLGDKPKFLYNFINKALNNQEIVTHEYLNGLPRLNLIHINDVRSFFRTFFSNVQEGCFNLGSSNFYSTYEVAQQIVDILDSKSTIRTQKIDNHVANIFLDSRKIEKMFKWTSSVIWKESLEDICRVRERQYA